MARTPFQAIIAAIAIAWLAPRGAAACPQAAGGATDASKPAEPAAPVAPASLPSGAELPPPVPPRKVRSDVFFARVQGLANAVNCPACNGTGTEVTRVREKSGHLGAPARIHEVREPCDDCKGSGCRHDSDRVAFALDGMVESLAAIGPGSKVPEKQLERSRQLLLRVASVPELAEAVAAADRNAVSAGRKVDAGAALTLVGTIGKPIPVPGGGRLIPVGTGAQSAVLLRELALNDAPASGSVLVGGSVAGAVSKVEWEWGQVLVLDHGFVVPMKAAAPAAAEGAAPAAPVQPRNPGSPSTSSASPIP